MSPTLAGIIGIAVLVILLFSGMPVGFAIFLVGFTGFSCLVSLNAGISMIAKEVFGTFSWYVLTVCPMFILMAYTAYETGISERLFAAANAWVGQYRGGLAMAAIVGCAAFGAICGDPSATTATMGTVALPSMKKYKYDMSMATGCLAAGGLLGIMIPPSIVLIVYGIITENSIAALFLAGILPGIMIMLIFMATIYIQTLRNPSLGPAGPPVSFKEKLGAFRGGVFETLVIFTVVMGGLIIGWFTPTEAGAVGAFSVILLGLVRRHLNWQRFIKATSQTTRVTAFLFVILAGTIIFSRFLAVTQIPLHLGEWISVLPFPRVPIMVGILLVYFFFGMVMNPFPFMLLSMPIFYPVVLSLGYDPIWFGVIMVCTCGMGGITPPVAVLCYVIAGVARDVPLATVFRGVWPFVGAISVAVLLLIAFPQIATFLPDLVMPAVG